MGNGGDYSVKNAEFCSCENKTGMNTDMNSMKTANPSRPLADIRLVAFDADDTLWDNQTHFDNVEQAYTQLLSPYGSAEEVSAALFSTETANMSLLGYGCKAFTLSLVENAVRFSHGHISAADILTIVNMGKRLLSMPATPLPGVEATLRQLRATRRYKLAVLTKGELLDQQNKVERSGLSGYFDDVVVVADKNRQAYLNLCERFDTSMSHLLMVGNSFKSDIAPVLQLGGYAAYIPFEKMWKHELTEEYDHPRLRRLSCITELTQLL